MGPPPIPDDWHLANYYGSDHVRPDANEPACTRPRPTTRVPTHADYVYLPARKFSCRSGYLLGMEQLPVTHATGRDNEPARR